MELRALLLLLLCFPGLQAQIPAVEERRREGDTLFVQCPYRDKTNAEWKGWCYMRDGRCDLLAYTDYSYMGKSRDGRTRIKDNPSARTVSVTFTGLKAEDSGTYSCIQSDYSLLKTISLNVFKEVLQWELDVLVVQCPHTGGHTTTWCRRERAECGVIASTGSTQRKGRAAQDRTSIVYSHRLQGVIVTMKQLQAQDTGVYWCALDPGRTRKMEVVLSVFKRTQQHTAQESGNVSVQCLYKNTDYGAVSKAWCKAGVGTPCEVLVTTSSEPSGTSQDGRVRIQDNVQQGIVTVTMEQLQAEDSGVYWCALHEHSGLSRMEEVTLNISKGLPPTALPDTEGTNQATPSGNSPAPSSDVNTFILLSVVLSILLVLALGTSVALCVRLHRLLGRTGNREAEDTCDSSVGTAQLGSTRRRESSQGDSRDLKYTNRDLQSQPRDPLYCNIDPSQAHRNPREENVEYAAIAFNHFPRNDMG